MAVTRADVARRAGVSPGLVSYVLNDGPRGVSPDKRARILAAIDELGYRPDVVARQLRTGRSQLIGLVVPDLRLPYFAEATERLSALLSERGYQLLVATSSWDTGRERGQLVSLAERGVDGMIVMSVDPLQDFTGQAAGTAPLVLIDRPQVAVASAEAVTRHLLEHGYDRVAFVSGPADVVVTRRHRAGWQQALATAGIALRGEDQHAAEVSRSGGFAAARALLDGPQPPSAVYVESDAQAVGLLRAAWERGLRVPGDLAVVTTDGTDTARYAVPSLTSVEYPVQAIAEDALGLLLAPDAPPLQRLSNEDFTLVPRESCGCS